MTAGAFSLSRLEGGLEGPLVGWLIGKLGPRRLMLFGVLSVGLGFVALSHVDSLWMFYIAYGVLLSIGFNTGFFHPSQAAAVTWFRRQRGTAVGLMMSSVGLGGGVVVPLVAWLVDQHGWRTAALTVGLGMWLLGLPMAMIVRSRPEDHGLLPDGDPPAKVDTRADHGKAARSHEPEVELTLRQAVCTAAFWTITLFMVTRLFAATAVLVHKIPLLIDFGYSPQAAANWAAYAALVSVPFRMGAGWLGDRLEKCHLLALLMVSQGLSAYLLGVATNEYMIILGLTLWGLGEASAPLHTALRADYFGRKHYALISGCMSPFIMLGSFSGPLFAGYAFDTTGSYSGAFQLMAASFCVSAVTVLLVRPPKQAAS
jgi:sugar phosphate permease